MTFEENVRNLEYQAKLCKRVMYQLENDSHVLTPEMIGTKEKQLWLANKKELRKIKSELKRINTK